MPRLSGKQTRLAILADIHADAGALKDALASIRSLGCDRMICLGDLVDYGVFPEETISIVREQKIPCIAGNHDHWAVKEGHDATGWDLTSRATTFIEALSRSWKATLAGVRVCAWHARPGNDMDGVYVDAERSELTAMLDRAGADVLLLGHTHSPMCVTVPGRGLVVNPGALLRDPAVPLEESILIVNPLTGKLVPAPKDAAGVFGVLELPSRKFTVHQASDGCEVHFERRNASRRWRR